MAHKAPLPWETREISYSEWGKMDFDWVNQYKLDHGIPSYFFRYDNYKKGLTNEHILKSTFGRKTIAEINLEIEKWFNINIGAYTRIEYDL